MDVRIMERHLKKFVKELSPCHRNCSSKRDVQIMGSLIVEDIYCILFLYSLIDYEIAHWFCIYVSSKRLISQIYFIFIH